MDFKVVSTENMLHCGQSWTTSQRNVIESHDYLAVHLPRIEQRNEALRQSTRKDIDPYSLEKQKVRDDLQTFDHLFDEGHRCLSSALEAFRGRQVGPAKTRQQDDHRSEPSKRPLPRRDHLNR